jgi:hypothetical protein
VVVYLQPPPAGPEQVLEYLARSQAASGEHCLEYLLLGSAISHMNAPETLVRRAARPGVEAVLTLETLTRVGDKLRKANS